jgi:hypothetical protein
MTVGNHHFLHRELYVHFYLSLHVITTILRSSYSQILRNIKTEANRSYVFDVPRPLARCDLGGVWFIYL